jgi:hypothetical protein
MPVALLDIVDEGLYLLALHCHNCELLVLGLYEDAELEAFDQALERSRLAVRESIEALDLARFIDEAEVFMRALRLNHVLPEDF